MNEFTTWVRRSVCVAVWLVAAGLYGCGGWDAEQDVPAQDVGQDEPAHDDFRHAHMLHPDYGQSNYVLNSASLDVSHEWGAEQSQKAYYETSGNKPTGSETSMPGTVVVRPSPDLSHGWTPQQFMKAYNVPATLGGKPAGYGIKVAIITAYHYSNLQYDLNKWAKHFGVKTISLNIINQAGNAKNTNWALASTLAVQMVNTVSPGATVYVIEAKSESQDDVRNAMTTAVNLGVNIIAMPFGADETGSQDYGPPPFHIEQDPRWTAPPGFGSNVVWIAASGDSSRLSFPATHPGVIAVGGTTLSSVDPFVETAWANAGAGMSIVAEMPGFQMIPSVQERNTTAYRSLPDVAFNADPEYGAHIYTSILGGYFVVGGTSVSTAFFAGVVAIANQARKNVKKPLLTSVPSGQGLLLQDSLYQLMSTNGGPSNSTVLNDVVNGYAGEGAYPAGHGYDIATGLGSLNVEEFIDYMVQQ